MNILDALQEKVTASFGLLYRPEWRRCAKKALAEMTQKRQCDAPDLVRLAETDKKTLMEFASYLTVSETYFLRHPEHFNHLARYVDRLLFEKGPEKIVIWCAGCSTGEEPYSAAIVLWESSIAMAEHRVEILANDISQKAIAKALDGEFGTWSFRDVPPWFMARYFQLSGDVCRLSESVRNLVSFKCIDLQDYLLFMPPKSVDAVLFRNVSIYLEKPVIDQIYSGFATVLRDGGCLIVAPADPRPPMELFTPCDASDSSMYLVRGPANRPAGSGPRPRADRRMKSRSAGLESSTGAEEKTSRLPSRISGLQTARQCGNQGDSDKALEMVNRIVAAHPAAKEGYLLRGQIHLSNQQVEDAVKDLRRAIFIDSENRIARFWYAYALNKAGLKSRAGKHLDILANQLMSIAADTVLEDGDTCAEELLQTVLQLKASLQ